MQHREWNPKAFFKQLTPEVIAEYEGARGIALVRDPSKPPGDQTYFAWMALPEDERLKHERELLHVNDLCSAHARVYLDDLAQKVWVGPNAHLVAESRDWTAHDLAMRLYLADRAAFEHCHQGFGLDMMEHFHEFRGKHPVVLRGLGVAKAAIKREMAKHFRRHLGTARCTVEDHEGKDKVALFVIHEDERTPVERFDERDNIIPDWQRPVVRVACVFYPDTSTLLVKAPRARDRDKLRDLFAEIVVGEKGYFEDATTTPKYCFDVMRDPNFEFPTNSRDNIVDVSLVRVMAPSDHADIKGSTVNLMPGRTLVAVHDALAACGIHMATAEITGIRLQFRFAGTGRSCFRTVSLVNPGSTNLRDTLRDRLIRRYLKEWTIDGGKRTGTLAAPPRRAA